MFEIAAIFLVLAALLAYLNHRFIGLPMTTGVMVLALGLSLLLIALDASGWVTGLHAYEKSLLRSIDFSDVVLQGMLSLLLFAAALHVDLQTVLAYRWQIGLLAVGGTLLSTLVVGVGLWWLLPWIGQPLPMLHCLLFGALISPTDPIAVVGTMRKLGAPKSLEMVIAGESLFNDGVSVVAFSLLAGVLASGEQPTMSHGLMLFFREGVGGLLFGAALGYLTFRMLRSIDDHEVEVLITLAVVMGGYALANRLHVSGPLAMVVAGLLIGNDGRALAMSGSTRHRVDVFWELLDVMLNAVLFVLIGMEVIQVSFAHGVALAGFSAILITLFARWLTVGLPVGILTGLFRLPPGSGSVLTWGGLRGGISVALVLSLPGNHRREVLLALTYCVVSFSILVQGMAVRRVVRSAFGGQSQ